MGCEGDTAPAEGMPEPTLPRSTLDKEEPPAHVPLSCRGMGMLGADNLFLVYIVRSYT